MTQRRAQQHQQEGEAPAIAPFPTLPAQVSSASSLNSNASSNATASTLTHQAASAQAGSAAEASANSSSTTLNIPAISTSINTNSSLGLLSNNYSSSNNSNPNYNATAAALASASIVSGTVPEFLYQLTKMLTDPNNDIIEWSTYSGNGRIEVHNPSRLESEVLSRYFRHSKYSSFQRQLNYFGFRKIAGKGKMSPCSYVNDAATLDIRSLLLMKRKGSEKDKNAKASSMATNHVNAAAAMDDQNNKASSALAAQSGMKRMNPGNDIQPATVQPMFQPAHRNISFDTMAATVAKNIAEVRTQQNLMQQVESSSRGNEEFHEIKRTKLEHPSTSVSSSSASGRGYTVAQGKGIRHQLNGYLRDSSGSINNTTTTASAARADGGGESRQNQSWSSVSVPTTTTTTSSTLQFLDPNELGMSVTSATYLNQLKNNYAAVATTAAGSTSTDEGGTSSSDAAATAQQASYPSDNSGTNTNISRVSSQASFMGMLSRDDSLINLAMLPTLDTTATTTTTTATNNATSSNNGDSETFGFVDYNPSSS